MDRLLRSVLFKKDKLLLRSDFTRDGLNSISLFHKINTENILKEFADSENIEYKDRVVDGLLLGDLRVANLIKECGSFCEIDHKCDCCGKYIIIPLDSLCEDCGISCRSYLTTSELEKEEHFPQQINLDYYNNNLFDI